VPTSSSVWLLLLLLPWFLPLLLLVVVMCCRSLGRSSGDATTPKRSLIPHLNDEKETLENRRSHTAS